MFAGPDEVFLFSSVGEPGHAILGNQDGTERPALEHLSRGLYARDLVGRRESEAMPNVVIAVTVKQTIADLVGWQGELAWAPCGGVVESMAIGVTSKECEPV